MVVIIAYGWRLASKMLANTRSRSSIALGTYLRMLIIMMMVLGISAETFQLTVYMQIFFAGLFLAEASQHYFTNEEKKTFDADKPELLS